MWTLFVLLTLPPGIEPGPQHHSKAGQWEAQADCVQVGTDMLKRKRVVRAYCYGPTGVVELQAPK